MASGSRILTLRNSDTDLKYFAIPLTSDSTGSAVYGNDYYSFDKQLNMIRPRSGVVVSAAGRMRGFCFALGLRFVGRGLHRWVSGLQGSVICFLNLYFTKVLKKEKCCVEPLIQLF